MSTNTQTFVTELTPGTLEKKGVAYAPRTLASLVYMDDGTVVSDILKEMLSSGKRFILRTKTEQMEVSFNAQRIYEIPTPLERYNFDKFPLIVSINNVIVDSSNYAINGTQLILTQEFSASVKQNDIIMFIFHYLDIIIEDGGINAESVNNIRYYVGKAEPRHKKSTDVWFDTTLNQVKQFNGEEWEIIVSGTGGAGSSLAVLKNTNIINSKVSTVEIGIPQYNSKNDILFVYLNSTYLEETQDYTIVDNNKISTTYEKWDGSEEPQIFNFIVFKNVIQAFDGIDGKMLNNNTISENKLSVEVLKKINSVEDTPSTTELLATIKELQNTVISLTEKVTFLEELIQE